MAEMEMSSSPPATDTIAEAFFLHPRREPFEHGLLPIPKLIFSDPGQVLLPIKDKLLTQSSEILRVSSSVISEVLQISADHARLLLDTIASVLHCDDDPLISAEQSEMESVGANVYDLILFLYIQSYKRLLPRTHKDAASVADVWPSTSAFDGYLSALSPLQLVRSNSRRFMPSQADEEAHQLSYMQKHLANILALLSENVEGEEEESLVLTMDKFDHLGFLIHFVDVGGEKIPLRQAAPFFANSHPDMPAAPVSATLVHDWLIQHIAATLEYLPERGPAKENGPSCPPDQDATMSDASVSSPKPLTSSYSSSRGPIFVEGISKSSFMKQASDIQGHTVKVLNCHDSAIYILAPLRYATVYGCSDATIVIGAVGKALRVEHCERVHVVAATKRICIANCRECMFFLGVNHQPLIVGDNHKLQVAPYNTCYPQLEEHMVEVGIEGSINRWNEPMALGVVDPHDSLSHPAGVSDVLTESASKVDPEQLGDFLIPNLLGGESVGPTLSNPFPLPDSYLQSQQRKHKNLTEMKKLLREAEVEESRKKDLSCALHVHFKDWLYASGNVRQLYCLQAD